MLQMLFNWLILFAAIGIVVAQIQQVRWNRAQQQINSSTQSRLVTLEDKG
jgi:hypothetical protein